MAKRRRANGEGTVGKLSDGRWAASALVQRLDGSYTRIKREAKTRATAMARLEEAKRAIVAGVEGAGRLPTVAEHLEAWHRDTFSPGARSASRRTYRWLIDNVIVPHLGKVRLDKLSKPRLRQWLADLGKAELAPKTISMARSVLRQALDQAVEDGLVVANPIVRSIKGPSVPASGGKALTPEQARALLVAARGSRLEAAIRLALGLALRRGEVCGLRWADIDMAGGTLSVKGQIVYTPGQGLSWSEPKTKTALRTLHVPAVLLSALRWHQTRQEAEHKAMGWPVYVFTGATTGGPLTPSIFYDAFKAIAKAAGLEGFRLHDLRHSAASFLLAEGVSLKKVQQILGHARGATTLGVYGHLLPGEQDDATERIQRRLESGEDDEKAKQKEG
jgi:integrase